VVAAATGQKSGDTLGLGGGSSFVTTGATKVSSATLSTPSTANQLDLTRCVEEHVGVTVGEHALHSVGVDALLPATRHRLAPRLRRRPLTVDVRFVQDGSSLARDP
jgi:hypothetical protein